MPDIKNIKNADAVATKPEVSEPEFEYVTIPDRDLFDLPHPGVALNRDYWGPGTYKLSKPIAAYVKERLAILERQNVRILQPRKDMGALHDLGKARGTQAVDLTNDNSKQV